MFAVVGVTLQRSSCSSLRKRLWNIFKICSTTPLPVLSSCPNVMCIFSNYIPQEKQSCCLVYYWGERFIYLVSVCVCVCINIICLQHLISTCFSRCSCGSGRHVKTTFINPFIVLTACGQWNYWITVTVLCYIKHADMQIHNLCWRAYHLCIYFVLYVYFMNSILCLVSFGVSYSFFFFEVWPLNLFTNVVQVESMTLDPSPENHDLWLDLDSDSIVGCVETEVRDEELDRTISFGRRVWRHINKGSLWGLVKCK